MHTYIPKLFICYIHAYQDGMLVSLAIALSASPQTPQMVQVAVSLGSSGAIHLYLALIVNGNNGSATLGHRADATRLVPHRGTAAKAD
ncbi:hypothetical protein E4U47_006254 [Claviceps purpurea]|nr:hypothetical protein E4U47_006254 [Claviceps purpurea]